MIVKLNSTVRYTFNGTVKQRQIRFPKHEKDYKCIAPRSPMGRAMLGKKAGDKFKVKTPGGMGGGSSIKSTPPLPRADDWAQAGGRPGANKIHDE
jgi:hypothetical protein